MDRGLMTILLDQLTLDREGRLFAISCLGLLIRHVDHFARMGILEEVSLSNLIESIDLSDIQMASIALEFIEEVISEMDYPINIPELIGRCDQILSFGDPDFFRPFLRCATSLIRRFELDAIIPILNRSILKSVCEVFDSPEVEEDLFSHDGFISEAITFLAAFCKAYRISAGQPEINDFFRNRFNAFAEDLPIEFLHRFICGILNSEEDQCLAMELLLDILHESTFLLRRDEVISIIQYVIDDFQITDSFLKKRTALHLAIFAIINGSPEICSMIRTRARVMECLVSELTWDCNVEVVENVLKAMSALLDKSGYGNDSVLLRDEFIANGALSELEALFESDAPDHLKQKAFVLWNRIGRGEAFPVEYYS
jgi:hypothetical protein